MDKRVESLSGWWHAYFEVDLTDNPSQYHQPANGPRGGWRILEELKQSVPVPGTWHEQLPGFRGTAWYSRPFMLADNWCPGQVTLAIGGISSQVQVYLDEHLVGQCHEPNGACLVELGSLELNQVYHLAVSVWHYDDTGGITGPVTLIQDLEKA